MIIAFACHTRSSVKWQKRWSLQHLGVKQSHQTPNTIQASYKFTLLSTAFFCNWPIFVIHQMEMIWC
uniref:Uncharacterized protein n=1 Tax=Rhizophora mucronata TaxID=61149 RepID=A0A2P2QQY0_RHIMU